MTSTNLFGRLFKYRPGPDRRPEEDFFTEAFAGVLEQLPELAKDFVAWLSIIPESEIVSVNVNIETQISFLSSRAPNQRNIVDLVLTITDGKNQRHIVFLENKLASGEGEDQLARYKETLDDLSGYASRSLVYVTLSPDPKPSLSENSQVRFSQKTWSEVHRWIGKISNEPLADELRKFMEERGMSSKIRMSELIAGMVYTRSQKRILSILDEAWSKFSKANRFSDGNKMSYRASEVSYWSPREIGTGAQIYFGITFDTSDSGPMDLKFRDDEIPMAFIAVTQWGETAGQLYKDHREYFDKLGSGRDVDWLVLKDAPNYIVRKAIPVGGPGAEEISTLLENFFKESFDELAKAPFLST